MNVIFSKKIKLFTLLVIVLTYNTHVVYGQFSFASDNASDAAYGSGFGSGQNGGNGFNAWSIMYGSNTGSFIGNPAFDGMGTSGIGTQAFAFYATGGSYLNASRSFETLQFNDVLSFYWAMNWDANSGNKGFDLKSGGTTVFNVNNAGNQNISTTNGIADSGYGTDPMLVTLKRTGNSTYEFSMTSRSGGATYTTTINSASAINNIEIYIGGQNDESGQRNIYFNHFNITNDGIFNIPTGAVTYTRDLSETGALSKTGSGDLVLTGNNTYTGSTTINNGTLELLSGLPNSDVSIASSAMLTVSDSDIILKSLIVDAGGTATVGPGNALTISNNLTVDTNGNLSLQSTSTTYSSLIVNGTASGNISYDRHVNQNASSGGNDLIASPVGGETFGAFAANNANLVQDPNNANRKLFGPFDKTSSQFLIYDTSVHGSVGIQSGLGYRAATTDNGNLTFTGTVNTNTVSQNISVSGPSYQLWNLIGNPYPSYLYVKENFGVHPGFLSENASELDANFVAIYGYDDDDSDGNIYTIWNLANTSTTSVITPGQGFFVASKSGGGTISFTPNMRSIGSSDDFILGRTSSENNAHLKLQINNSNQHYATDFYFNDAYTFGLDPGYDAGVFGGTPPAFSLYSQLVEDNGNAPMAIQALPFMAIDAETEIPLGVKAVEGQQITFRISENTLPESTNVYLEDREEQTTTLLNTSDYILDATTALSGYGRFYLRFSESTLSNQTNVLDALSVFVTKTQNILTVKGLLSKDTLLNLYDLQGRLILTKTLASGSDDNRIDVSGMGRGVYVVMLNNRTNTKTQKVILH